MRGGRLGGSGRGSILEERPGSRASVWSACSLLPLSNPGATKVAGYLRTAQHVQKRQQAARTPYASRGSETRSHFISQDLRKTDLAKSVTWKMRAGLSRNGLLF